MLKSSKYKLNKRHKICHGKLYLRLFPVHFSCTLFLKILLSVMQQIFISAIEYQR